MKHYDFDKVIDRQGTNDVKHELLQEYFGCRDLLPLWVADMDFETPDFIRDAIVRRIQHPICGYSVLPQGYWEVVGQWIESHHQWHVEREWMHFIPGIVKGIGLVVNSLTTPGDKVIIQPPVYHPFRIVPEGNGREIIYNPLIHREEDIYEIDFEGLERVCDEHCRLLILANPHNPIGICWSRETLVRLAEFCHSRGIIVVSDEIHCDMALFGHKHIPFASVSDKAAQTSITFQAPTKTFNMAGMISSYCIVPSEEIRKKFYSWIDANEFASPNMFSPLATVAAFTQGEPWRKQMLSYIEQNIFFVEDYCRRNLPCIHPIRPQASFLVWLDCRGLHLKHDRLVDLFVGHAHLALNDGAMFGGEGDGYMRLNVGVPRVILEKALSQLKDACEESI